MRITNIKKEIIKITNIVDARSCDDGLHADIIFKNEKYYICIYDNKIDRLRKILNDNFDNFDYDTIQCSLFEDIFSIKEENFVEIMDLIIEKQYYDYKIRTIKETIKRLQTNEDKRRNEIMREIIEADFESDELYVNLKVDEDYYDIMIIDENLVSIKKILKSDTYKTESIPRHLWGDILGTSLEEFLHIVYKRYGLV